MLITVKEAAKRLKVSERTVHNRIRKGLIKIIEQEAKVGRGGKIFMIDTDSLFSSTTVKETIKRGEKGVKFKSEIPNEPNEPSKKNDTIPNEPNESPNELPMTPLKLTAKKQNREKKERYIYLDFAVVLRLYEIYYKITSQTQNEGADTLTTGENRGESEFKDISNERLLLAPGTENANFEDKGFVTEPMSLKIEGNTNKVLTNVNTIKEITFNQLFCESPITDENESSYNLNTPYYKKLTRDISAGILITRKDPADLRKTQIRLLSLSDDLFLIYSRLIAKPFHLTGKTRSADMQREANGKSFSGEERAYYVQRILEFVPEERNTVINMYSKNLGINHSTIWRWIKKYQESNSFVSLERKTHKNKGVFCLDGLTEEVKWYFWNCLACHPKMNAAEAAELTYRKYGIALSKRQTYSLRKSGAAYLKNLTIHYPHIARYKGKYFGHQTREGLKPLELVTADGHRFDIVVNHPTKKDYSFRPMVVEIYDVASGMTLGWAVGENENLTLTSMALTDAVLKFGHFQTLLVDQGKSFWKSAERRKRIYDLLHIDVVSKRGYSPHLKAHEERNFGELERNLCQLLPGYIGNSVANRTRDSVSKDRSAVLSFDQFFQACYMYFDKIMPNRPQGGLSGKTAKEFWQDYETTKDFKVKHFWPDPKELYKALVIGLGEETNPLTVRRASVCFSYNKERYIYWNEGFSGMEGEKVKLIFSPHNPAHAYVFFREKYMFEAEKVVVSKVGESSDQKKRIVEATNKYRKELLESPKWTNINLFEEKMQLVYNELEGFTPQSIVGDISDTDMDDVMKKIAKQTDTQALLEKGEIEESGKIDIFKAAGEKVIGDYFD